MSEMSGHPSARSAAWQRWEMTRFDAPAPPPSGKDAPAGLSDTAQVQTGLQDGRHAELNAQRARAVARGYAEGYAQGKTAGHADGLEQGRIEGHAQGLAQGRAEGLQAGFTAGLQDGQEQGTRHAQQLGQLARACADALDSLEHHVGRALVDLACAIAERIVHSTLDAHPEKIVDIVRDIVHMHGDGDAVLTLRVHPQDHARVAQHLENDGALKRWRLVADPTLQAGGCHAETALGAVDATLQTRWRKALGALGIDAASGAWSPAKSVVVSTEHEAP